MATALTAGARHDDSRIGVIREWRGECHRRVTGVAVDGNARMTRRIGIACGTDRDGAVVAGRAASSDTRVIERSVRIESDETRSRVAIAAFLRGDGVTRRFAGGGDAIVTTAARAENFVVIDKAFDVETQGVVAGLTLIARRHVGARLDLKAWIGIRGVARIALDRQSAVKTVCRNVGIGRRIGSQGGVVERHYQGHRACARLAIGADDELHCVRTRLVGHERWVGGVFIRQ